MVRPIDFVSGTINLKSYQVLRESLKNPHSVGVATLNPDSIRKPMKTQCQKETYTRESGLSLLD